MRRSATLALMLLAASAASPARAGDDRTFVAKGVFTDGTTLGGVVVIDETAGTVASDALTFSGAPGAAFGTIGAQGYSTVFADYFFNTDSATSPDEIRLGILSASLVGYAGGSLSSYDALSPTGYVGDWRNADGAGTDLVSGSLSPAPEPGGLSILAAGALAALAASRRRAA